MEYCYTIIAYPISENLSAAERFTIDMKGRQEYGFDGTVLAGLARGPDKQNLPKAEACVSAEA
ncbi:MAG TPA: hypothetical protein DCZ92_03645 [Elusimicrobia bacterium]|nr:hypothetical protein [Elusimicrobiota bacterium]